MAGRPLRPARDRRLGGPLPRQLANPTQAHPPARGPKVPRFHPRILCGISPAFAGLSPTRGQIPTRYSPVRHSSAPEGPLPFDLHVLGMPPAFNLSHDQTLQFNLLPRPMGAGLRRPSCLAIRFLLRRGSRPKADSRDAQGRKPQGLRRPHKLSVQTVKESGGPASASHLNETDHSTASRRRVKPLKKRPPLRGRSKPGPPTGPPDLSRSLWDLGTPASTVL